MNSKPWIAMISASAWLLAAAENVNGAIVVPGANGLDGEFASTEDEVIDLAEAQVGTWDTATLTNGKGVYDPDKWAVVFRYTNVNIPAGVTVRFANRAGNPPVVWLVSGDVTIAGTVDVSAPVLPNNWTGFGIPGPGGFSGGRGSGASVGSGGFGIGGGRFNSLGLQRANGGSFATSVGHLPGATYSDPIITALIGGSGGGGGIDATVAVGGGGGGAILIALKGTFRLNGQILASGAPAVSSHQWSGGGSGGSIRIVAGSVEGGATGSHIEALPAIGNNGPPGFGSVGRIRIEGIQFSGEIGCNPAASSDFIADGSTARIFPDDNAPSATISEINGLPAPSDPRAAKGSPPPDLTVPASGEVLVRIVTQNMPPDSEVKLYLTPFSGQRQIITAEYEAGDYAQATWKAEATLLPGRYGMQVHALSNP